MSILVKQLVCYKEIAGAIRGQVGPLLRNLQLVDIYKGKQIPEGFMSLTIFLEYGAKERTLTDTEVSEAQDKVIQKLTSDFNIQIR